MLKNNEVQPYSRRKKTMSRLAIIKKIAQQSQLTQSQVNTVFETLAEIIQQQLSTAECDDFLLPKIGIKIKKVRRGPTKRRITRSPLTEKSVEIKAKPARWDLKVVALKKIKDICHLTT
jgi:nucleoid DNA-binding protein